MATEDFSGIHEDHLSIIKGQKVTVVEMTDDWIRGCHGNQDGWFPRKCVQGINTGSKIHSKHEGKTNSVSPLPILNTSLHLLGPFAVTVVDRSTLKKPLYKLSCPKDGLQSDDADSVLDEADPSFVPLKKNNRICSDVSLRENLVQSQNGNVPCDTGLDTEMDATPSEPPPPVPGTLPPEEEESGVESMSSKDLDEVQDTPRGTCSVEIDNGDENDNVTVIRITNQGTSAPDTECTPRESFKDQTDQNSNDISSNMQNFEAEFDRIMSGVAVSPDKPADTDIVTKANSLPVTSTPNIKQYKAPETSDPNSENELERLMSEILEEHEGKPESMEVKLDSAPVSPILHQEDERLPKPPSQDVPKGGRRRKKRPAPPVPTSPREGDGASSSPPLQNGSPPVINLASSTRSSSTSPQRKPRAPPPLPDYILSGGGRQGKHGDLNSIEKQNKLTNNVGNVSGTNQDCDLSSELSIDISSYDETGDLLGEIMESLCASPTASALSDEFEGKLRDLSLSTDKSHANTESESAICIQEKDPIASGVSESRTTMDDASQSVPSSNEVPHSEEESTPRKPPRPKKSPSRRSSSGASYDRKIQDSADSGFQKRKVLFTGDGRENNETSTADGGKSDNVDIDATLSIKSNQPDNTHLTSKPVVKPPPPKSFSVRRSSGQSLYDRMHAVASSGGNLEDFFSGETKGFTSSNETETDVPMKDFEELKPESDVSDKLHIVPGKVHLQTNEDSFDTLFIDNDPGESSTDPSTYHPELISGKLNNAHSSSTVGQSALCNKQDIHGQEEPAVVQDRSKVSKERGSGRAGLTLGDSGVECREEEGERVKEKPVVKPRRSKSNAETKDPKRKHNKDNVVSNHEESVSEKINESALMTDTAAVVKSAECDTKDVCSPTSTSASDAPEPPSNKAGESKPIMAVKPVQKVASTMESSSGQHGMDTGGVTSDEVTPIPPPRRRRKKSFNRPSSLYSNSDAIETIQESLNSGHTRLNEKNVLNTVDVSPVKKVTEPSRTIDSVVEVKRRQKKASRPPHLNKRMSMPVLQEGQLSPAPDTVKKRLSMPGLSASELVLRAQKRLSSAGSSPVVEEKSGSRFSKTREVSKKRRKCTLRRAVQEYEGQEDGELSFHVDSFIKELSEVPERPGWAYGMLADGVTGLYPMDYVEDLIPSRSQSEA